MNKASAELGRKGGQTKGKTKSRGDAAYYRALVAKRKRGPGRPGLASTVVPEKPSRAYVDEVSG